MKNLKLIIAVALVNIFTSSVFSHSFEGNYLSAMRLISMGHRIQAQKNIKRCIIIAKSVNDYIRIAKIYYSLNSRNVKIHEYLAKAYRKIKTSAEAIVTATSYYKMLKNKRMTHQTLMKGLYLSKKMNDAIKIARAFKHYLNEKRCANQALVHARKFAKSIEDWIKISDICFNEFSFLTGSSFALKQCWKVANNREEWAALGDAYKRIGYISKAVKAYNRAKVSIW